MAMSWPRIAASTAAEILAAQLALAPSHTIPPTLPSVLETVAPICSRVPPHSQVMAAPAPQAAQPQAPADYARARLEDVLSFTRAMFAYWTQQPFPCAFRRMLTLEQFRSPDMGRLYQQYLGSGPVGYLRDLFASMRPGIPDERAQSLAVALFAPLHLLFALTDGGMPSCRAEALLARQLTAFRQVYEQEEIYAISQERSL